MGIDMLKTGRNSDSVLRRMEPGTKPNHCHGANEAPIKEALFAG